MALERVSIKQLTANLGAKDVRTTYKWCEKNGLIVYFDGRMRFVLKNELDVALDGPIIDKLQQLYPNSWQLRYESLKSGSKVFLGIEENEERKMEKTPKTNESPFLKKLKQIAEKKHDGK